MKFLKRVLPFLLLNMLVSAATIYGVLVYWQRSNPEPSIATPAPTLILPTKISGVATPLPAYELVIENVFGAGDLSTEYIMLRNIGSQPVNLSDWQIRGPTGENYTFPVLNLNTNGAVRLYSRVGTASVRELYWGAAIALWNSGDTLTLTDSTGIKQATFTIP
ncbi:MAG: lamin tail domain-containing protein [Anaerolineaceae bacterium]